jgi:ribose-phosphate pyrophosphokinase
MKTINLAEEAAGDIKYKISHFPDGQQDIVIDTKSLGEEDEVHIVSRFNSFKDFEIIRAATMNLRRLDVERISLYVPYLLGARSDREFQDGGNSYLVDVIAPLINQLNFKRVTVLDVHNPNVTAACINKLKAVDNSALVEWALQRISKTEDASDIVFLCPDAGARDKIYKLADKLGIKGEIVACTKQRSVDGKLSNTHVPLHADYVGKKIVIIDDICDGGRTFINIASIIRDTPEFKDADISLIVTHGIFSAGFDELHKYFNAVYCTNSVSQIAGTGTWNELYQMNVL